MDPSEYRTTIERDGAAVAAFPATALDLPVPTCPGWSAHRLVAHLGRVHRWAAGYLEGGSDAAQAAAGATRAPAGADVLTWYVQSLEVLLDTLDRSDPTAPSDTFAGPTVARFWFRRQALELAVHRWDAENALGAPRDVDVALAADGIEEWLSLFVPRFYPTEVPAPLVGASLSIRCGDHAWTLWTEPSAPRVQAGVTPADAVIAASPSTVFLALWHRLGLGDADVVGDAGLARAILDLVHVT